MSMALAAACLVSSCNKDVIKTLNSGMSEGDKRLEKRIQEFYGRMKSIQQGGAANKNAKTTGDVYISVDSAEFLIESTYNYYVAGTDDDSSEVIFNTLSFDVSLPNDSVLSESEVAGYMLQIKDSIMLVYDNVSYADKQLALFDLEIHHVPGSFQGTFDVNYSIIANPFPRPTQSSIPGPVTNAYGVHDVYCSTKYFTGYPVQYQWMIGALLMRQSAFNGYVNGRTDVDVSAFGFAANATTDCSTAGAAVVLRGYGINNYKAQYGYTTPGLLHLNITGGSPVSIQSTSTSFDYKTLIPEYLNFDQYAVEVTDDGSGRPMTTGTAFLTHWLNVPMMNFYLTPIPGKINTQHGLMTASGTIFHDFQILRTRIPLAGSKLRFDHKYFYYFATPIHIALPIGQGRVSLVDFLLGP